MFTKSLNIHRPRRGPLGHSWRISSWWSRELPASVHCSLLHILSVAHAERLELAPLLRHFASEHRGWARLRLNRLASRLEEGLPWVAALEQTPNVLSDADVLTLRFASESGTLNRCLPTLVEEADSRSLEVALQLRRAMAYGLAMLVVSALAISFLMTFIAPTLSEISQELGVDVNGSFESLVSSSDWLVRQLASVITAALIIVLVIWIFRPVRRFRRLVASRCVPSIVTLRTAQLLRLLSLSTAAGRPVPGALSTLARYHFDANVRSKLLFARNEVEQGADAWQSLATTRLLTTQEAEALHQAATPKTRAWLMHRLADWKQNKVSQQGRMLAGLAHPLLVLLFGGLVLWCGLAYFGFLSHLILLLG